MIAKRRNSAPIYVHDPVPFNGLGYSCLSHFHFERWSDYTLIEHKRCYAVLFEFTAWRRCSLGPEKKVKVIRESVDSLCEVMYMYISKGRYTVNLLRSICFNVIFINFRYKLKAMDRPCDFMGKNRTEMDSTCMQILYRKVQFSPWPSSFSCLQQPTPCRVTPPLPSELTWTISPFWIQLGIFDSSTPCLLSRCLNTVLSPFFVV